jgi:putative peptidoglycan lipid II flippase
VWFLAGAVAFAAYSVVVRGYFATRNTLFPALFGTAAVLFSLPLYPLGILLMGVEGVAFAVSISGILQAAALFVLWSRRSGNAGQGEIFRFYLKIGVLSGGMALVLALIREAATEWVDPSSFAGSLVVSAVVGVIFLGLMLAAGYGLSIKEIQQAAEYAWDKIQRKSQTSEASSNQGPAP